MVLCNNLDGWGGGGGKAQEGVHVYIYIYMADLHCCTAETNTTL